MGEPPNYLQSSKRNDSSGIIQKIHLFQSLFHPNSNLGARTTNSLEGWHNKFNKRVKTAHVNIYELISKMKDEQEDARLLQIQLEAGNPPPPMVKKYRVMNEKLGRLMARLESNEISLPLHIENAGASLPDPFCWNLNH